MDNLKQLGKTLKKNKNTTDFTLRRASETKTHIERVSDYIDSDYPLTLYFKTYHDKPTVKLDMFFRNYATFQDTPSEPVVPPYVPPEVPPPPDYPDPTPGGDLQDAINGSSSGGTLVLTGFSFNGQAVINKPLTIVGGALYTLNNTYGIKITSENVTIDGMAITGRQDTTYNLNENLIEVDNSSFGSLIEGITVQNCILSKVGLGAVYLRGVTGAVVSNNTIFDCVYHGVMMLSASYSTVENNHIYRIGYKQTDGTNAYGIATTRLGSDPISDNMIIDGNTIEDIPTWHGLDTHWGTNHTWSNNIIRRVSRGIFLTGGPVNQIVHANQVLSPSPVTYNIEAITLVSANGVVFTDNIVSGWGSSDLYWDEGGASTNISGGNNFVTP